MRTPSQRLFDCLAELGVPVTALAGGPTELHVTFDAAVTDRERRLAYETIAAWDWSWGEQRGGRGD